MFSSQSIQLRQGFWLLLLASVLVVAGWSLRPKSAPFQIPGPDDRREVPANRSDSSKLLAGDTVASYVLEVLQVIDQTGQAPAGYVGGRPFFNRERRLPLAEPSGKQIEYREWDVHPRFPGKPRGAERLVTGSNRSAWYTKDHYRSFQRLR